MTLKSRMTTLLALTLDSFNHSIAVTRDGNGSTLSSRHCDIQATSGQAVAAEADCVSALCRVHLGSVCSLNCTLRRRDRKDARCSIGPTTPGRRSPAVWTEQGLMVKALTPLQAGLGLTVKSLARLMTRQAA